MYKKAAIASTWDVPAGLRSRVSNKVIKLMTAEGRQSSPARSGFDGRLAHASG